MIKWENIVRYFEIDILEYFVVFFYLIIFYDFEFSNYLEGIGFILDVRLIICFVIIILLYVL